MHFDGILVLVDRVDEPYLINGSTDLMRALVWPMLDNKFLKHPGPGAEAAAADRIGAALRPRGPRFPPAGPAGQAEPDPLAGVGPANRSTTWPTPGSPPAPPRAARRRSRDLFDGRRPAAADGRVCRAARAAAPVQVHVPAVDDPLQRPHRGPAGVEDLRATFESVLALYQRDQDAFDRGVMGPCEHSGSAATSSPLSVERPKPSVARQQTQKSGDKRRPKNDFRTLALVTLRVTSFPHAEREEYIEVLKPHAIGYSRRIDLPRRPSAAAA